MVKTLFLFAAGLLLFLFKKLNILKWQIVCGGWRLRGWPACFPFGAAV